MLNTFYCQTVCVPSSVLTTSAFATPVHFPDFLNVPFAETLPLTELHSGVTLEDFTNEI